MSDSRKNSAQLYANCKFSQKDGTEQKEQVDSACRLGPKRNSCPKSRQQQQQTNGPNCSSGQKRDFCGSSDSGQGTSSYSTSSSSSSSRSSAGSSSGSSAQLAQLAGSGANSAASSILGLNNSQSLSSSSSSSFSSLSSSMSLGAGSGGRQASSSSVHQQQQLIWRRRTQVDESLESSCPLASEPLDSSGQLQQVAATQVDGGGSSPAGAWSRRRQSWLMSFQQASTNGAGAQTAPLAADNQPVPVQAATPTTTAIAAGAGGSCARACSSSNSSSSSSNGTTTSSNSSDSRSCSATRLSSSPLDLCSSISTYASSRQATQATTTTLNEALKSSREVSCDQLGGANELSLSSFDDELAIANSNSNNNNDDNFVVCCGSLARGSGILRSVACQTSGSRAQSSSEDQIAREIRSLASAPRRPLVKLKRQPQTSGPKGEQSIGREQELLSSPIAICGKVTSVQFFPDGRQQKQPRIRQRRLNRKKQRDSWPQISAEQENDNNNNGGLRVGPIEPSEAEGHREEETVGRLVVCLDINELERRRLMGPRTQDSTEMTATGGKISLLGLSRERSPEDNNRGSFLDTRCCSLERDLRSQPEEEEEDERRCLLDSLGQFRSDSSSSSSSSECSSDSDDAVAASRLQPPATSGSGFGRGRETGDEVMRRRLRSRRRRQRSRSSLREQPALSLSSPSTSSSSSPTSSAASSAPIQAAGSARRRQQQSFWRLVASRSTSTLNEDTSDEEKQRTGAAQREPEQEVGGHCPLLELIRAADLDPNNRPQLLLLGRGHSGGGQQPQAADWGARLEETSPLGEQLGDNNNGLQMATTTNMLRLNSIDEEEVWPAAASKQEPESEEQLNFSGSSNYSSSQEQEDSSSEGSFIGEPAQEPSAGRSRRQVHLAAAVRSPIERNGIGAELIEQPEEGASIERYVAAASLRNEHSGHSGPIESRAEAGASNNNEAARCGDNKLDKSCKSPSASEPTTTSSKKIRTLNDDDDVELEAAQREPQTGSANDHNANEEQEENDDDDYFYDDELAFNCSQQQRGSSSMMAPNSQQAAPTSGGRRQAQAATNSASGCLAPDSRAQLNHIAQLGAAAVGHSRPLLVWAPSARRVSCPVGQFGSFASWRQLWPPHPPLGLQQVGVPSGPPLCASCGQRAATSARTSGADESQQQSSPTNRSDSMSVPQTTKTMPQFNSNGTLGQQPQSPSADRKCSQPSLACSDYFSSFDQTTSGTTNASLQSVASSDICWPRDYTNSGSGRCRHASQVAPCCPQHSGPAMQYCGGGSGRHNSGCRAPDRHLLAGAPPPELRRQSTITGFDHYKYTAPRSPSLCLPAPPSGGPTQRRQPPVGGLSPSRQAASANPTIGGNSGAGPYSSSCRLSPTNHSTGSSSPSPTNWLRGGCFLGGCAPSQQQLIEAAAVASSSAARAPAASGGPSRGSFGRPFARSRLESLESDRGSSPSWSASTCSLRSSSSILNNSAGCQSRPIAGHRKLSTGTCNKCLQSGSICNGRCWPNDPRAGRQSLAKQQPPHQPLSPSGRKLSLAAPGQLLPSREPPAYGGCNFGGSNLQQRQQQLPGHLLQNLAGQQLLPVQQQQQAVYFFLCCCQRKSPAPGDSSSSGDSSDLPNPTGEQPAQGAGSSQLQVIAQEPQRRVSLIARPAIVGADSSSQRRPQPEEAQRLPTAMTAPKSEAEVAKQGARVAKGKAGEQYPSSSSDSDSDANNEEKEKRKKKDKKEAASKRKAKDQEVTGSDEDQEDNVGGQLTNLLGRLDRVRLLAAASSGRDPVNRGADCEPEARRENLLLIESIRQRLVETERLLLGGADQRSPLASGPAAQRSVGSGTRDGPRTGSDLAMRYSTPNLLVTSNFEHILRQRDRRAKQEEESGNELEGEGSEAAAWFLSRSPAGSKSPASVGGGQQRSGSHSQQQTALATAGGSRESVESTTTAQQAKVGGGSSEHQQRRRSAGILVGDAKLSSDSRGQHKGAVESLGAGNGHANGSAPGERPANGRNKDFVGSRAADSPKETSSQRQQSEGGNGNPISGQQPEERKFNLSAAEATGSGMGRATATSAIRHQVSGVHDKSMAQARYLYSTLTSQATALLAASSSGSGSGSTGGGANSQPSGGQSAGGTGSGAGAAKEKAAAPQQSPSPTRVHGVQRKQAHFVAERQQMHQSRLKSAAMGVAPAKQQPAVAPLEPLSAKRPSISERQASPKPQTRGRPSSPPSSSGSEDEAAGRLPDFRSSSPARRSPSDDEEAEREVGVAGRPLGPEFADSAVGAACRQTPCIVESQWEAARRQSQESQKSRANSLVGQLERGASASEIMAPTCGQPQQSLQPTMDPAMHALWAQGADLDTGNGNFIMATRRRRSVHALNQAQLHQIQQQQQQQGGGMSRPLTLSSSTGSSGDQSTAAAGSKCYKIDERAAGRPLPAGGSESRGLRFEMRKLRATSSIDEVPQGQSSARARFVSDPARQSSRSSDPLFGIDELSVDWGSELSPIEGGASSEQVHSPAEHSPAGRSLEGPEEEQEEEEATAFSLDHEPSDPNRVAANLQRLFYLEDADYDLDELESSGSMLANLFDWNYPIFELADRYGDSILSKLSYRIFFDSGFFDSFKIPKQAFFNFFHALEEGYHHKPYHNRLHAADVLHAVYYLTSQPIDNFCQVPLDLIDHYDNLLSSTRRLSFNKQTTAVADLEQGHQQQQQEQSMDSEFVAKLRNHIVAVVVAAAAAADDSELPFGIMGANLTALEVMALYTAAAMHDFQHPGRTNSFLVATSSPLALLYNDRSVLENHHSAAAWALFYSGPNFNWLCNLEKDEFKRFRFMIIELILATDLMRHYELVSAFNKKLNNVGRHNIDWFCESDRLLVMEIIIKLADVNGPMKGHQLHCQWTDRIAMEFYEQGDEERALNLPVSLYMDRSDPRLPELQKSFINHLVGPLSHSYAAAGFFPRPSPDQQLTLDREALIASEEEDENNDDREQQPGEEEPESVYNQTKYWLIDNTKRSKLNEQFLRCMQTSNLRSNFLYWDAKSREKQQSSLSRPIDINQDKREEEADNEKSDEEEQ